MSITRVRDVILVQSERGRQWPVRVRHYMERGRHLRMRINILLCN